MTTKAEIDKIVNEILGDNNVCEPSLETVIASKRTMSILTEDTE